MASLSNCPKCKFWLKYEQKTKEWYCEDCGYTEVDARDFKKFRKELD